jgi:excisionase family DNA binding protein
MSYAPPSARAEGSSVQPLVYTVAEVALALSSSERTVYEWIKLGRIPSVSFGRRILVPRVALQRLVDAAAGGADA